MQLLLATATDDWREVLERMGISLYFAAIAVGGAIVLSLSLLFAGDHDHDTDHDTDHDSDHDHGDQAQHNLNPVSFKIFLAALTGFGVGGFTGARFGLGWMGSSVCGIFGGFAVGYLLYVFLNWLYHSQSNSAVRSDRLVGTVGTVDITIRNGSVGRVTCSLESGLESFLAQSATSDDIGLGIPVRVVSVVGSTLIVEPIKQ